LSGDDQEWLTDLADRYLNPHLHLHLHLSEG